MLPELRAVMDSTFESGFDKFWKAYPSSPRKGAKALCREKWVNKLCESNADQIIKHVEWMKTTDAWLKQNGAFIPAPLVYLNQQRWDGAEIPETKEVVNVLKVMEEENKKAIPMPADIKAKLDALRGRA
jgi:hypothetical protein